MATIATKVVWARGEQLFTDHRYSRTHQWLFDGGSTVAASASPDVVPVPLSDPAAVDPEEAFVVSISSCHMLWFLAIVAKRGFVIDSYEDHAVGEMSKSAEGKTAITAVTLKPKVTFSGDQEPTIAEKNEMHHEAHEACFIANSVKTDIRIQPEG